MSSFFGLRLRRTTSATRYETWTHPPSSSNLARVDQPKPGHALPCVTVAGGAGSERCAHSRTFALRRRSEDVPPFLREKACAPAEGTESEESPEPSVRTSGCDRAPARRVSSTRGHRCVRMGLGETYRCVPTEGSASSALSAKSGRFLVNRGAFHRQDRTQRRRSLFVSTIGRPPSHVMLPFGSPCGFASRGSAYAFVTFP
jgi:hypothetical protein